MRSLIIDGGGSTTDVGVTDGGSIVFRKQLQSMKPTRASSNTDELCLLLAGVLADATPTSAHVPVRMPQSIIIGMAGIWTEYEKKQYAQRFAESWTSTLALEMPPLVVLSDAELVLFGAFGQHSGTVLIAGTGSICLRRQPDSTIIRSGGWGPQFDDVGGGVWLGNSACRAVARMLDGRGLSTLLIRPVAAYLRVDHEDHEAVAFALRGGAVNGVARLGAAVLSYADEGDAVAQNIREEGAASLAELITCIGGANAERVCVAGSLLTNEAYRNSVARLSNRQLDVIEDIIARVAASTATV